MTKQEIEHVRDLRLADRLKLALGGIPTLTLCTADEVQAPLQRKGRSRDAILADLAQVYGEVR